MCPIYIGLHIITNAIKTSSISCHAIQIFIKLLHKYSDLVVSSQLAFHNMDNGTVAKIKRNLESNDQGPYNIHSQDFSKIKIVKAEAGKLDVIFSCGPWLKNDLYDRFTYIACDGNLVYKTNFCLWQTAVG